MMHRSTDRLLLLEVFLRALERGSISRAAEDLGMSQSRASKLLRELEDRLGQRLLMRSTHHLVATEAGVVFAQDARSMISSWNGLLGNHGEPQGARASLSVVATSALGPNALFDLMSVHVGHEGLGRVRLSHDDSEIPFSRRGCDLWVRVGAVNDDALIVRSVGRVDTVIVASPDDERATGAREPADLDGLDAAASDELASGAWTLSSTRGRSYVVRPELRVVSDRLGDVRRAARLGLCIGALSLPWVSEDLESGRLVRVLPDWTLERRTVSLVYAPSRYESPLLRELIDSLKSGIPEIRGVDAA